MGITAWDNSSIVMHMAITPRPSRVNTRITVDTLPELLPKDPAIDYRVGATVVLDDGGGYSRPVTSITKRIELYAPGVDVASSSPIDVVTLTSPALGTVLEYTIPSGPANRVIMGIVIPTDDLGRDDIAFYTDEYLVALFSDPLNTSPPTQTGTGYVGETITLNSVGIWTGSPTPVIDFTQTKNGIDIPGTLNVNSRVPALNEKDSQLGWRVWARGFEITTSIFTTPTTVIVHALRTVPPTITSTTDLVGGVATRVMGTCVGTPPPTMVGNWQRNGVNISGQTGANYTFVAADDGKQIRWQDFANGYPETIANSNAIAVRTATSNPYNITPPNLSGEAIAGSTLTVSGDTWNLGTPPGTVKHQWELGTVDPDTEFTVTIASPAVITWVGHGLGYNSTFVPQTTGQLPTGLIAGTTYYVAAVISPNTFLFSAIPDGSAVNTSGTQSGVHTIAGTGSSVTTFANISGATATTYISLAGQAYKKLRCRVWVDPFESLTKLYTNEITVAPATGVWPSLLDRSDWEAIQNYTPNPGSREMRFGSDRTGGTSGSAKSPAGFNLYAMGNVVPIDDTNINLAKFLVDPSGNDTISLPNDEAMGTPVYHTPVWENDLTKERRLAHSAADTVTIGGVTGMYGLVILQPEDVGGGTVVNNDAELRAAIIAAGNGGGTIKLKSGVIFREFMYPFNRDEGTLSNPLIITSTDKNNPAIVLGILLTGAKTGQFIGLPGTPVDNVRGVWFDYITIYGERFSTFTANPQNVALGAPLGSGDKTLTSSSGGGGFSITVAGCKPPAGHPRRGSDGYHTGWTSRVNYANSTYGTVGINVNSGCQNIRVTNCEFNGFAHAVDCAGGASNIHIANNRFNQNCVDQFKLGDSSNLTSEWNVFENFRTLTKDQTAVCFPPKVKANGDRALPDDPHADLFQSGGNPSNLRAQFNYLNDTSGQCHFGLLNSGGSGTQQNLHIINNESHQSHATGWIVSHVNNLDFAYNKSTKISGTGNVEFNIGGNTPSDTRGTLNIHHNEAPKFVSLMDTQFKNQNGNVINSVAIHFPTGFTHIRQNDNARPAGARYCGIGGNPGNNWAIATPS